MAIRPGSFSITCHCFLYLWIVIQMVFSSNPHGADTRGTGGDMSMTRHENECSLTELMRPVSGEEIMSALTGLNSCIENDGQDDGSDVDAACDVLMTLGSREIIPTLEFSALYNITETLPSLFRAVEVFVRTLAVQQLTMDEDVSVYFRGDHVEIGLLLAEEHHVEVVQNLSTAGFDVDFPALIQKERSVGVILYKGLDILLRNNRSCHETTNKETQLQVDQVGSDILSTSVYSLAEEGEEITNITMTFTLKHLHDNATISCAYWKFADGEENGGYWTADGCWVLRREDNTACCVCTHLTNFAILVQVTDFELSDSDRAALSIIGYAGCSVSIIGAALSVLVFLTLRIVKDRVLIHLNLSLAILAAQTIFLFEEAVPRHTAGCVLTVVLLYYFNMATFCWMLCEGIHLYLTVVVVFTSDNKMKVYHLLGWGLPLVIVTLGTSIVNSNIGSQDVCWFSPKDNSILVFVVPAMLIVLVNVVILVLVMAVILRLSQVSIDSRLKRIRKTVKASVLLLPILGTTWLLGVLAISNETIVFQYLFALTNSTQGLLLFLCHCISTSEVQEAFSRKKLSWELNRYFACRSKVRPASASSMSISNASPTVAVTEVSKTSSVDKLPPF